MKLRQSHLLPTGAPPETQAAQAEAWTAGIAYAALLHDVGKVAVDLHVECADGKRWYPWHGTLHQPYRFHYRRERIYRLHSAAAGLLYAAILDRAALDWLSGFSELWAAFLFVLAGQHEHAGILGEMVTQADQASVAQELGGDPSKVRAAPKQALQRKLLEGLRYLVRNELKLNQPQASDGWLTHNALWLVAKTVCDKLRAHLLSQGIDGIPDNNIAVFNVLQDHGLAQINHENKVIWRAIITSDQGWTHAFTLLKLSPSLIWENAERPPPFHGTVQPERSETGSAADAQCTSVAAIPKHAAFHASSPEIPANNAKEENAGAVETVLALLDADSSADAPPAMVSSTGDPEPTASPDAAAESTNEITSAAAIIAGCVLTSWSTCRGPEQRTITLLASPRFNTAVALADWICSEPPGPERTHQLIALVETFNIEVECRNDGERVAPSTTLPASHLTL